MQLFKNKTADAVQEFIEPYLEKGEALKKYTLSKSMKALGKAFAALGMGIVTGEMGLDIELEGLSGFQEFTLLCLTNQRLIFGGVMIFMDRRKTRIFPKSESDGFASIPLSDIGSASYKSGLSKGTLTIRLEEDDEIRFFFHWKATGRHAKEMAKMITSEVIRRE